MKTTPENQTDDGSPSGAAPCSALRELLENLEEWGEHFREQQHGATLTLLRARKTITDQAARIDELLHALEAKGICPKCNGDGYVVKIVRGPHSQAGVAEDCECQSPQNAEPMRGDKETNLK